jgi:hypothetical protein
MAAAGAASQEELSARTAAAEQMAIEASRLARAAAAHEFTLLAYLFDMAALEAWRQATDSESE